jgi:hypothetical protein
MLASPTTAGGDDGERARCADLQKTGFLDVP